MNGLTVGTKVQYSDWTGLKQKVAVIVKVIPGALNWHYVMDNGDELDTFSFFEGAKVIE